MLKTHRQRKGRKLVAAQEVSNESVLIEQHGAVAVVKFNRPERLNAWSPDKRLWPAQPCCKTRTLQRVGEGWLA
jgi:hypothetical protein